MSHDGVSVFFVLLKSEIQQVVILYIGCIYFKSDLYR